MSRNQRAGRDLFARTTDAARALRSRTMRAVKSRNTGAEMIVRRLIHGLGYRYRLHVADLPGTPDLVFRPRRKAIFVNGCFWHGHHCPRGARQPKQNAEYWSTKIARNVARDASTIARLTEMGFSTYTVWECELKDAGLLAAHLRRFLGPRRSVGD